MRLALAVTALVAGTTAACAPPQPLSADPRIVVQADAGVVADAPAVVMTQGRTVDVSVPLRNRTGGDVAVQCLTDWYTAAGQPIQGLSRFPTRADLGVGQRGDCRTVSPAPTAADFRMIIQPVPQ